MKKKFISILLVISMVSAMTCFSALNTFASVTDLEVYFESGATVSAKIDGYGDLAQFVFTPEQSGTYSFLTYNSYKSVAYLFDDDFNQLAYSDSSPNYKELGQSNSYQACMTYHLDAGKTYYYYAGCNMLSTSETEAKTVKVMIVCDEYDVEASIDHIEVKCTASLDAYTDGFWTYDSDGVRYYYYNISKLVANTTVTVYYSDGSSTTSSLGAESVDGYDISYNHSQYTNHWYYDLDDNYVDGVSNIFTVSVLNYSIDLTISIGIGAMRTVKGVVVDYLGNAVEGAVIKNATSTVATTNSSGAFSFAYITGTGTYTVSADYAITRTITITISADTSLNDHTDNPIYLVVGDYNLDDAINAKDLVIIRKFYKGDELTKETNRYKLQAGFQLGDYEDLVL